MKLLIMAITTVRTVVIYREEKGRSPEIFMLYHLLMGMCVCVCERETVRELGMCFIQKIFFKYMHALHILFMDDIFHNKK